MVHKSAPGAPMTETGDECRHRSRVRGRRQRGLDQLRQCLRGTTRSRDIAVGQKDSWTNAVVEDDGWELSPDDMVQVWRHVVAVIGDEWEGEFGRTCIPLGLSAKHAMGHLAQRTMSLTESCTDPIGNFAPEGCIRVVNPDDLRCCRLHVSSVTECSS